MKAVTKKRLQIATLIFTALIILIVAGFYVYTLDYYHAEDVATEVISSNEEKRVLIYEDMWVFEPAQELSSQSAFIFYPGGKVEAIAYAPLLHKLSQQGITSVLMKMPFNLAVFDTNAADRAYERLPDIHSWYIGGHSLGGAMASSYANKNSERIEGLILLGAYPVGSNTELPMLALYGSEDTVLDKAKLDTTPNKHEIKGGNHAYFGNYGEQKGDGTAAISREEQQNQTVEAIVHFINGQKE